MSSVRRVQTERLLEDIVRSLYSSGIHPVFSEVSSRLSQYFSKYPAGNPLPLPIDEALVQGISDPDAYNELLSHLSVNLDVLYETSLRQVEDVLLLTSSLQAHLERLRKKRRRIETRIDDYLLSQYNTDGYYYSVSDNFADLSMTDLNLTTAQVDTESGAVILPTVSSKTNRIGLDMVGTPSINVTVNGASVPYTELAPFTGAVEDSLDNIVWAFEVETNGPREVVAVVDIPLGNQVDPVGISRIDFSPYGATPVQVFFQSNQDGSWVDFGKKIERGTSKMIFGDSVRHVSSIRMTLRKTEFDYTENRNGQLRYRYIFGAKEISFLYQVYDSAARFVSRPLYLPTEYNADLVIDAVSIDVEQDLPSDAELSFYVAASRPRAFQPTDEGQPDAWENETEIDDLLWRPIIPILSNEPGEKVVRFGGAAGFTRMIRENPGGGDLELLPPVLTGAESDRNPTTSIIEGVTIYKIADLADDAPLTNSVELVEGVNTTRIISRNVDNTTPFSAVDLEYWAEKLRGDDLTVDFGRIDTGAEFFYGGDVGASGRDVYIETFIECDTSVDTFLAEFQKVDVRSRTWDLKIFLNGRPLGNLPAGTNQMQLPWSFRQGLNHIIILARIPLVSSETHSFMGALSLMGTRPPLQTYGSVHLAKWGYVDMFTMRYNESGEPRTFTIHEGKIISRRKPTTNFQLKYAIGTGSGPEAVRFRAEFKRSRNNPTVTPRLRSYRLRFSYSEGE